jgi:hypothetical protein
MAAMSMIIGKMRPSARSLAKQIGIAPHNGINKPLGTANSIETSGQVIFLEAFGTATPMEITGSEDSHSAALAITQRANTKAGRSAR